MKTAFSGKISYFVLMFIFLLIIAGMLFSGFDNFRLGGVSANDVGEVDGTPITVREYQMALNRQVEFFNQMMGGNGLSNKQLEEMGIKDSVLSGLIQQKLILNSAKKLGIVVSLDEVKSEIRNMPYFKNTQGQFDVNQYRNALQMNGYSPSQFEDLIRNDLRQRKMDELFNHTIVSEKYVQDVHNIRSRSVTVSAVKISRQALSPLISVSEQEIKDYLAKPENKKALEDMYTDNASKYNKAEEVKARHILITGQDKEALEKAKALRAKVNTKNFAKMASENTQDPTGKSNGGELGWFSAGRMVPEFDAVAFKMNKGEISEPVKTQFGYHLIYVEDKKAAENKPLESVKHELAQLAIQRTKPQDLDNLLKTEAEKLTAELKKGDLASVEATAKKVEGEVVKDAKVNMFDQTLQGNGLSSQEVEQLFKAAPGEVLNFGNPGIIYLVKVVSKNDKPEPLTAEVLKKDIETVDQAYSRKVREEVIKSLNNKAKVVTNRALM
jgi:peptidyl-prolyl cis-trans isomerase D